MIKFFRKIRQKLLSENKFSKYLIYAIGEIVLVVIGILIALQINNWNTEKIEKKKINSTYTQIQQDLKTDIRNIRAIDSLYNLKLKRIQNILGNNIKRSFYDNINALNYKDCKICISEPTNYNDFQAMQKGIKTLNNSGIIINDSIQININQFYETLLPEIQTYKAIVVDFAAENIKEFEQYSWFEDYFEGRHNEDFIRFIFENKSYRNKLVIYKLLYGNNYITSLQMYSEQANEILKQLEVALEQK